VLIDEVARVECSARIVTQFHETRDMFATPAAAWIRPLTPTPILDENEQ